MLNYFKENFAYIEDRKDYFYIKDGYCEYSRKYELISSKEDKPGLTAVLSTGKVTINSQYYPVKESQKSVDNFTTDKGTIVCLGLGLGYHLVFLKKKYPQNKIIVVEPDKSLFYLFCKISNLKDFTDIYFYIGYKDYEVENFLTPLLISYDFFVMKGLVKLNYIYFKNLIKRLSKESIFTFEEKWKYNKFADKFLKIIFIDSGYLLSLECTSAIQKLGHSLEVLSIDKENYDYEVFVKNVLNQIDRIKPDFVLTINHLGFDFDGILTDMFTSLELPFVSWYVDSPTVVLSSYKQNISPYCNLFVWDRDYISDLKKIGYENVDYLPLATMPDFFCPMKIDLPYDVSFVGSSMCFSVHKNLRSFVHRPELIDLFYKTADRFLAEDLRYVEDAVKLMKNEGFDLFFQNRDQKEDFYAGVIWRATQIYRMRGLKKLADFNPVIFGDPNWDNLLDNRFNLQREVFYYKNLPQTYNQTKINFNMTSRQMKNSVNQRVFDVPACNKFILTDYKQQLEEIFDIGRDIICFKDVEEIPDLVRFYLKNESIREKIARAGREKVLANETYEHRLSKMIEIMRARYRNA